MFSNGLLNDPASYNGEIVGGAFAPWRGVA